MNYLIILVPIAIAMGLVGLGAFLWSLRSGQYDDLDGAAERILLDEDDAPADTTEATGESQDRARQGLAKRRPTA